MQLKSTLLQIMLIGAAATTLSCSRITAIFDNYECTSTAPVKTQTRSDNSPITAIKSSCGLDVTYIQSDTLSIKVTAPEDLMDMILTEIDGTELKCSTTKSLNGCLSSIKIEVKSPMATDFSATSGSSLNIASSYNADNNAVTVASSSGADISIPELKAQSLSVSTSSGAMANITGIAVTDIIAKSASGASIDMSGTAENASYSSSSGADISASTLIARTGSASASSGGSIRCNIENHPQISTSSGGDVHNE